MKPSTLFLSFASLTVLAGLTACGGNDNTDNRINSSEHQYQVELTNLTTGQPLSPFALVVHQPEWQAFAAGSPASVGLEQLAESGANQALLDEAAAQGALITASASNGTAPGQFSGYSFTLTAAQAQTAQLSLLSMMVNTNDAFVAANGLSLSNLPVGELKTWSLSTYDAGTEANTETSDTVPGPAATGGQREGFNASRDDVRDAIYIHPGVLTSAEGLNTSTLTEVNRWQDPSVRVSITRLK